LGVFIIAASTWLIATGRARLNRLPPDKNCGVMNFIVVHQF
jgi:hypothetical protein